MKFKLKVQELRTLPWTNIVHSSELEIKLLLAFKSQDVPVSDLFSILINTSLAGNNIFELGSKTIPIMPQPETTSLVASPEH